MSEESVTTIVAPPTITREALAKGEITPEEVMAYLTSGQVCLLGAPPNAVTMNAVYVGDTVQYYVEAKRLAQDEAKLLRNKGRAAKRAGKKMSRSDLPENFGRRLVVLDKQTVADRAMKVLRNISQVSWRLRGLLDKCLEENHKAEITPETK